MHASAAVSAHERHRRPFAQTLRENPCKHTHPCRRLLGVLEVVSSTSHTATNLALGLTFFRWPIPMPPTPMTALVTVSLGGVLLPMMWRGTIETVAAAAIAELANCRRVNNFKFHCLKGDTLFDAFAKTKLF